MQFIIVQNFNINMLPTIVSVLKKTRILDRQTPPDSILFYKNTSMLKIRDVLEYRCSISKKM